MNTTHHTIHSSPDGNRVLIIAEAGVNHNGSLETAREMVRVVADAGADMVKFQTFKAEKLVTRTAAKAEYQQATTGTDQSQYEMIKALELDNASHEALIQCCQDNGIQFLSTAFDLDSIDLLAKLGQTTWKIPSGEITNLPYLRKIGGLRQQIILSTGMADLGEIENALQVLQQSGTLWEDISVLHCNTEYPTPMQDVNLNAMLTIRAAFPGIKVGYSDHTLGIEIPIAAVALGATVIEKQFTLDRNMEGPDHRASLEPDELKEMVRAIRNVETALGHGAKRPSPSEAKNKAVARKSIVAACPIRKGETFTKVNLTVKRPGTGLSPMLWDELIDQCAGKDYVQDALI
jgi:N,N'-diacetyllegionaminate synthase